MYVYAVSIIAFRFRPDLLPDGRVREGSYAEHLPGILMGENILSAAERSKALALERWPKGEGWYGHQAAIQPASGDITSNILGASMAGDLYGSDEQPDVFQCE